MTAPTLTLTITQAGQAALAAAQLAQANGQLAIATLGLTAQQFVAAPTLTALPGEFRRIASISGALVGDQTVHLVLRDDDPVTYAATGFRLYLTDGTLFAAYGQATQLLEKSAQVSLMAALDVAFPVVGVDHLTFGDANWLNPPATHTTAGVVTLIDADEARAGNAGVPDGPAIKQIVDDLNMAIAARLPIGMVMLWSGVAAAVPAGWAICDGRAVARSDGAGQIVTPDLRDRVPVGAGGAHGAGDVFGAPTSTVNTANAGSHTPAGSLPAHHHGVEISGVTGSTTTGVTSSATTKTDTAGGGTGQTLSGVTLNDPGHNHAVDITANTADAGPLNLSMQQVPDHAHQVTVNVTQPSLALFYVMKV